MTKNTRNFLSVGFCSILLVCIVLPHGIASAQKASLSLDTSSIRIGEQVTLRINATLPKTAAIFWPVIADTLTGNIEVVSRSKVDTNATNRKDFISYSQSLRITSFDTGYHVIPSIAVDFRYSGDTARQQLLAEGLYLKVRTVEVDTTRSIRDIKGPMQAPLTLAEILPYVGIVALAGIIIGIIWYLLWRRKMNKPLFPVINRVELPPWQNALLNLQDLENRKLWQSGKLKEYYTELTEIIRHYLLKQHSIEAMEMISDEIMDAFDSANLSTEARPKLLQILRQADFVKFAKAQPTREENSQSMTFAKMFVEETKPLPPETENSSKKTQTVQTEVQNPIQE